MTVSEIKAGLEQGKLVIGKDSVASALRLNQLIKVFVSLNGKSFIKQLRLLDNDLPIEVIELSSLELGVICKKQFGIAVLGLKK